ncbi:flagellar export protein FliJ [Enterobacter ludwigii]|uniref:flagellar export protein FliJ n=1 Tax=Enterobacter ludwigii TaxID=299767 RepID=UPI0005CFD6E8|nr:flagellar export protein FliJ [Enterobacter ludwigii]MED5734020.1 flagellar export protein FliJ [Enterobacter ludwigii]MRI48551.1 flagella biosynthesis chaperone FliJ [Enterobacter ludwigii]HDR2456659.1 flagella biosynthesis chaperone FliJ [Enterobacter ludwigii]HDR2552317.1 flagella biosynthesis chaperone FliJ [Enterobacter ludwigii]HDR2556884.1 flagella biosynthesis chaperone FliJ [Enterobacter ludwigii]
MKVNNPMTLLRDMAEETLTKTTRALGGVQQQLQQAVAQHEQLQHYEQEYQQSLRQGMMGHGMSVADLVNHQSFILSLKQVVKQQEGHVSACEQAVDKVKQNWVQNKQRLNAFETLIERRATAQALVQSRHEQKLMDEFAQRAGQKRERL